MHPYITQALALLQKDVALAQERLPSTLYFRLMTDLRDSFDTWWYDQIILRHHFSIEGACQVQFDFLEGSRAVGLLSTPVRQGAERTQTASLRTEAALRVLTLAEEQWQRLMTDKDEEDAATCRDILKRLGVSLLDADDIEDLSERRIPL